MKKYVRAAQQFPLEGSAGPANKKEGNIKFGSNDFVVLDNGWTIKLTSGVVRYNTNTRQVNVYLNISIYAGPVESYNNQFRSFRKEYYATDYRAELKGYTAEEFEEFMDYASNASYEDLDAAFPKRRR